MTLSRAFFAFVAIMLVGFLLVLFWAGPMVTASGVEIFDTRSHGYSFAEAQQILTDLSAAETRAYLLQERIADTIFPVGLLGSLALGLVLGARVWSLSFALGLTLVPGAYFLCDMLENAGVARLLIAGPDGIDPEVVARVSGYTVWKFRLVNAAFALMIGVWGARAIAALVTRNARTT